MLSGRSIRFTIPGRMRGKGRPRAAVNGGFARMYTDERTASAEAMVREFGSKAMVQAPPMDGPLHMGIVIYVARPTSWSNKQRLEKPIPTCRPDLDNIVKILGDSLNGVAYWDDSQIASLKVERWYSDDGERCEVTIFQIEAAKVAA